MRLEFIILTIAGFSVSCHQQSALEYALEFAGENRKELQAVLDHYSQSESDLLKYKAAVFLIENMPAHWYYDNQQLRLYRANAFKETISNGSVPEKVMSVLEIKHGPLIFGEADKKYDCQMITSSYLINNIDHAFKTWQECPWKDSFSFSDFCDHILPYRIGNEPLEEWRGAYYERYRPFLDSLMTEDQTPLAASRILYDAIDKEYWAFIEPSPIPDIGSATLLDNKFGSCSQQSNFATLVMRALGIPGGVDFRIQTPNTMYGMHFWNYVKDSSGKTYEFTLWGFYPGEEIDAEHKKGRVYRRFYAKQMSSLPVVAKGRQIPSVLDNDHMRDVSSEYFGDCSLEIKLSKERERDGLLYLSVFNNKTWIPIVWASRNRGKYLFETIEQGVVYLPIYSEQEGYYIAGKSIAR